MLLVVCSCVCAGLAHYVFRFISSVQIEPQSAFQEQDLRREVQVAYITEQMRNSEWAKMTTSRVKWFEEQLRTGTNDEQIMSAILLGEVCEPGTSAEDALIVALDTDEPALKRTAIFALGRMGSTNARQKIREMLRSGETDIKVEAKEALKAIDAKDASRKSSTRSVGIDGTEKRRPNP
jgi:hypothetical protein